MPGSDETASIALLRAGRRPVAMQGRAVRPPGDADDLETRRRLRASTRSPDLPVVPQDRLQAAAGLGHEAQPVLADVGILPADEALPGRGRLRGPEDDEQAAGRGHRARRFEQGMAVEPQHGLGAGR